MMDWTMIGTFLHRLFAFDPDSPLLFTQFYFWAFFAFVYAGFALTGSSATPTSFSSACSSTTRPAACRCSS